MAGQLDRELYGLVMMLSGGCEETTHREGAYTVLSPAMMIADFIEMFFGDILVRRGTPLWENVQAFLRRRRADAATRPLPNFTVAFHLTPEYVSGLSTRRKGKEWYVT